MTSTYDFSPLFRSSVGFDHLFDLLESSNRVTTLDNWPPYDIVKTGDDFYRITMAVAGFSDDELSITQQPNLLLIAGQKNGDDSSQYLHQGIAGRAFQRRFELAEHVKVAGAALENGLLTIDMKREIPEEMKLRDRQQDQQDWTPADGDQQQSGLTAGRACAAATCGGAHCRRYRPFASSRL